jgi:hypothetical protein
MAKHKGWLIPGGGLTFEQMDAIDTRRRYAARKAAATRKAKKSGKALTLRNMALVRIQRLRNGAVQVSGRRMKGR